MNVFRNKIFSRKSKRWIRFIYLYSKSRIKKMQQVLIHQNRSSHLVVFLGIGFPKICNKFTGEHPCWSAISKTFKRRFIALTLQHECSPVDLLYIFRTPFPKNTSGRLFLLIGLKLDRLSCYLSLSFYRLELQSLCLRCFKKY